MVNFHKFEQKSVMDIADVERAVKGKVYPLGSTLITLSAVKSGGAARFLDTNAEVETRWAVVQPHEKINSRYLYISINQALPEFLAQWQTGINLQFDKLQYLKIHVHDFETQCYIANMFRLMEKEEEKERQAVELLKNVKANHLYSMFV